MQAEERTSLDAIYIALEQSPEQDTLRQGTRQQRLRTASACDLFVSVRKPSLVRELMARFHEHVLPAEFDLPDFRSLEIHREREIENGVTWCKISVRVAQMAYNDIFTSLAEDIAYVVGRPTDEGEAAIGFRRRLYQWQQLLQKTGALGLTAEQQQGLYGELWCLREIVLSALSAHIAVASWTGPQAADRDFQFAGAIALEVKTTRSSSTPILTIASERQLDDTGLNALYVLHLALEQMQSAGETLPQIVATLRSRFASDPYANMQFEDKLLAAGYLEAYATRYRSIGYTLHDVCIYKIGDGFPRITPQELLPGVVNVRYGITSDACQPFGVDQHAFVVQLGEPQ